MKNKRTILKELKNDLVSNFGTDINDVILFGSRVTGKARKDSDYDILIIINHNYNWQYERKISDVIYNIMLKYDIFVDNKIISTHDLYHSIEGKHPLYQDAIRDGIHA